jgi:ubiquinone/menaquinone biosynthesis C-methylase UbiE
MSEHRDTDLMRAFWDAKARENATYYVSSYRPYDDQNPDEFWRWGDKLAEQFLEESGIPFDGTETMLEIGCGVGRMTRYFARRFCEVHGLDIAPEMISKANESLRELKNVHLHVGNGHDLSLFGDRAFDFVFSYITFQHIPKTAITLKYVREAGRVLKPGGHFYFQVNNMPVGIRTRLRLRSRFKSIVRRARGRGEAKGPARAPVEAAPGGSKGPAGLDHPAWRGSRVSVAQIGRACRDANLKILGLRGEGTQYMWVKTVALS